MPSSSHNPSSLPSSTSLPVEPAESLDVILVGEVREATLPRPAHHGHQVLPTLHMPSVLVAIDRTVQAQEEQRRLAQERDVLRETLEEDGQDPFIRKRL